MAFDGDDTTGQGSRLIYPAEYHPKAPLEGPVLGTALRTGYTCGRRSARLLMATHYAMNMRDNAAQRDIPQTLLGTTYIRMAEGYRYLPDSFNVVVAQFYFSLRSYSEATLTARVVVVKAGDVTTDTGAAVTRPIPPILTAFPPERQLTPFTHDEPLTMKVALSTVNSGQDVIVYVEAKAGALSGVIPHAVIVWAEVADG